jgi:acetoacetyl-[acyl-carrier protein] synthase
VSRLPVIIGFGGINPAGRVSAHRAYQRLIVDALAPAAADAMYRSLATLMGVQRADDPQQRAYMREHTLVRRIEGFDVDAVPLQRAVRVKGGATSTLLVRRRDLPPELPPGWQALRDDGAWTEVRIDGEHEILLPGTRGSKVTSAGQLPTGYDPGQQYPARSHPRGLQLTICGASDALQSLGIDWQVLRDRIRPDQVGVYSASAMGQLDHDGAGGLLQAHLMGKRPTSKQMALSLSEMPADFINAYVLGSAGSTAGIVGACATFLYNLQHGIEEIRAGRRRVVVVGNAEAPITPEVIEAYRTMGALAEDDALAALDGSGAAVDNRRACRPFSDNCGFTLAEAGVYFVLADDELALELGACIHGAIGDVFINADGYKKSIPGPGIGNYLTMGKALALAGQLVGESALRRRTFVQAHGTSTPQNRVTESHILSTLAGAFGIEDWIVCACKAYLGHTIAAASADQLAVSLGVFAHGVVPGITTIDHLASDVHTAHLRFPMQHVDVGPGGMDAALINSKGFGGNNATAVVLAPHVAQAMLARRHGSAVMQAWQRRNEAVRAAAEAVDARLQRERLPPIYRFGDGVVEGEELDVSRQAIRIPGFAQPVELQGEHPYPDMQ